MSKNMHVGACTCKLRKNHMPFLLGKKHFYMYISKYTESLLELTNLL